MAIHAEERFLADVGRRGERGKGRGERGEKRKVAVIGSGPAGLSCAYHLALKGHSVTVFEALPVAGGMMRVGIPDYRLPKDVLDKEIKAIEGLGVEIRTNMKLGDNLKISDLEDYDAVFIAVGLQKSRKLNIPGEDADGVIPGLDFLKRVNLGEEVEIGQKVAIIGGGNTAIDAARTCLRLGAEPIILYRRTRAEMPAIESEVEEAISEGVKMDFLTSPTSVLVENGRVSGLECIRMRLGEPDESGRPRPIPIEGSEFKIKVDTVITAIGQEADLSFLGSEERMIEVERGRIFINEAGATTKPGFFAGGDVATPFGTVAEAIGSGKRAAIAIDKYLRGEELSGFPPLDRPVRAFPKEVDPTVVSFDDLNPAYFEEIERMKIPQIPSEERVRTFSEVNLGFSEEEAIVEAERCFSCGTCNLCDTCLIFCSDVAIARVDEKGYEVNYDYCKGCGVCAEECPRYAISTIEEKRVS